MRANFADKRTGGGESGHGQAVWWPTGVGAGSAVGAGGAGLPPLPGGDAAVWAAGLYGGRGPPLQLHHPQGLLHWWQAPL